MASSDESEPAKAKRPPGRPPGSGHGGRRVGAGAPRARLPQDVLDEIGGPPIEDPLQMIRWWSKLLGKLTWLRLQGRVSPALVEDVRHMANTAKAMVPEDLRAEVARLLRERDEAERNQSAGGGAKLEPAAVATPAAGGGGALRGAPRQ